METIDIGDKVRHKTDNKYNALLMEAKEFNDRKILCEYFDYADKSTKEKWFDENELELIQKGESEFFNG